MSPKQIYPAATRNAEPILQILKKTLDGTKSGLQLLEVSSGTGQHALHFANNFPNITFQPTEFERSLLPSIAAYAEESKYGNLKEPLYLDISKPCLENQHGQFDYILNINMLHVSPWSCTEGLFRNSGQLLKAGGLLIIYGAMAVDGVLEPESNRQFDKSIRRQNREWGVRDVRDLQKEAAKYAISLRNMYDMPANNKMLVWAKLWTRKYWIFV